MIEITKHLGDGIDIIRMANASIDMSVSNMGCHILSLRTPDQAGKWDTVVLGYEDVRDCTNDGACLCAVCGRVANRIANATFALNECTYKLATNNGPHHLHGGEHGFDERVFDYEVIGGNDVDEKLVFSYTSPDGEEGYPGNLDVKITYRLDGARLIIDFEASSDADTIVNLTNHMYFNMSGEAPAGTGFSSDILGHDLMIDADVMTLVDETGLAYGPRMNVAGTPFDFRDFKRIGEDIDAEHEQIKNANGYDQAFVLNQSIVVDQPLEGVKPQAVLADHASGRQVKIFTSYPAIQIYTSNFLSGGVNGHAGIPYEDRDGIAIETQYLSNSIHIEKEPKVILRKGEIRREQTVFEFE